MPKKKPTKKTAKKSATTIYQFKITLLDRKPKIWRRIQIPDCKLNTLHYHIQAVMGWENSHLHHFDIKGDCPGDHVNIPAHTKHRVAWTSPDEPTIWLAVHYQGEELASRA